MIAPPVIQTQPLSYVGTPLHYINLSVTAFNGVLSYQWYKDGVAISGANDSTLSIGLSAPTAGSYTVAVTNSYGSTISNAASVTVNYDARLINLSARANVDVGNNLLIAGFAISGTGVKQVLLRGVGPGLASILGPGSSLVTLATPVATLADNSQPIALTIAGNSGWERSPTLGNSAVQAIVQTASQSAMAAVGAFPLAAGSADAAMSVGLPAGNYTSLVSGAGGAGIALAEIYDADPGPSTSRLVNLSARANVGTGDYILIGGFAISGTTADTVLIRAVGPRLASLFGPGTLGLPVLTLYDSLPNPGLIATNIGWGNNMVPLYPGSGTRLQVYVGGATPAVMAEVGAFPLQAGSADSAMLVTLPPGNYTAQVSGMSGETGIALIEIYEVR